MFPGLFIVLLLCILLIPFIYLDEEVLFSNRGYWTYFPNNLSLYGFQGVVPGVFDSNPYHAINDSLWTIRYEFTLYMFVMSLFLMKGKKNSLYVWSWLRLFSFLSYMLFFLIDLLDHLFLECKVMIFSI